MIDTGFFIFMFSYLLTGIRRPGSQQPAGRFVCADYGGTEALSALSHGVIDIQRGSRFRGC